MPVAHSELEARLKAAFPEAEIVVEDLAGDGDHYKAYITDAGFAGMPKVRQHQKVYAAISDLISGPLHALALETKVP
ncbi:BolA/IbaG family iron-sulfur metabolism protein [Asticcacaulis sp. BYS171W]|uniref:BolA/IbaG family iron-sulfur metabolism protein n=1 Tax=Asticcacaulis aquaticus TaxID=2984212 RepID=A0ABT5HQI4_9CAUL|nr:BolA/IbaG family iron-sulfur metabolism protein [Asticcacaulis aquaticus]MDC7682208.1 BolA/IbaG family iron-sulfur metabolism protein [Asticcacaulis aquaticus]